MDTLDEVAICPEPGVWSKFYLGLKKWAADNSAKAPPMPLILAGWAFSSDVDKFRRWNETKDWLIEYKLEHLLDQIADADMYKVIPPLSTSTD